MLAVPAAPTAGEPFIGQMLVRNFPWGRLTVDLKHKKKMLGNAWTVPLKSNLRLVIFYAVSEHVLQIFI